MADSNTSDHPLLTLPGPPPGIPLSISLPSTSIISSPTTLQHLSTNPLIYIPLLFPLFLLLYLTHPSRPSLPLPPSPPGFLPILGHLLSIPTTGTAAWYTAWGHTLHTDIVSARALGTHIIVLNSVSAARALLDKKGAIYGDRQRFILFEIMGWSKTLTFLPASPLWSLHRRILQSAFSPSAIRPYASLQTALAHTAAATIYRPPPPRISARSHSSIESRITGGKAPVAPAWKTALRYFSVAVALKVSYGIDVPITMSDSDEDAAAVDYLAIAEDAMYVTGHAGVPGGSIADVAPVIRYLPGWLTWWDQPLAFARKWGWAIVKLHDVLFTAALADVKSNKPVHSLAHSLLRNPPPTLTLPDIRGAAGATFIAGADTTFATLVVFILFMLQNPSVQRQAQAHLDAVLQGRLPTLDDKPSLPIIENIVQEVYRYAPLAPLGIPHRTTQDDFYNGMFIPKGFVSHKHDWILRQLTNPYPCRSHVYFNNYAMSRDPNVYSNADTFDPSRYDRGEPKPVAQFGFGRRICVGRHLAHNSLWIMVATILTCFNISKSKDAQGNDIEQEIEFSNGGTCHPEHFDCSITIRSSEASSLLSCD